MSDGAERFRRRAAGTAEQAADAIGCEVDQIVKSLVLMADDTPVVALVSGVNRVDLARLASAVGAEQARMATPDEVRDATGFAVGGTPPFGHEQPLRTVVDPALLDHDRVWAAAGAPDATFPIGPDALVRLSGATVQELDGPGG